MEQLYLVMPHELHFHMVYRLLREHIDQEVDYKVLSSLSFDQTID